MGFCGFGEGETLADVGTAMEVVEQSFRRLAAGDAGDGRAEVDAAGDVAETARLVAAAPEGFEVYSGEDALTLALLAVGAVGVVSVASHWATPETVAMVDAFFSGNVAAATEANRRLIPSWDFESGDLTPNPVPSKAMMKVLGLPGGDCRPPMGPEPDDLADRARQILAGLGRA